MATQTQAVYRSSTMNPGRTHDYLYDPHFVSSSERDHARSTFKAHTSTDRVKRVPIFKTMFSELRHHPRFQMRLDITDPVPRFIDRQWRGYAEQQRAALIRHTTFNYDPTIQIPQQHMADPKVLGINRYKYFRRPIIPFLQQVPPEVLLATARQDPLGGSPDHMHIERPPTPLTRTVEIQTDYRDGEAQTDPYTPEYVVRPGSQPELLTLATLSYGRGLPAGLAEVEMIERARAKREWEATLPALNDTSQLDKRRKMMDEMETKEWALREQEIEKLQEARLDVLKKLLKQREENHQELNIKRLDRLWSKKQEEKERRVKIIRNEHIKALRKLAKKRRMVEGKFERRDVVNEYSGYGSQVYAPLTRIGVFLDRGSEQYVVKSHYLNSYEGLLELEASLPDYVTNPRVMAPRAKTVTKSGFIKRKYRQENELAEIHQVIKHHKTVGEEEPKPLRFLQKIEKPIPRPPTPTIDVPSDAEEDKELAIIFLQQVIRGRAIQNMMFEGKEKRMELIKELRSTHALQDAEQQVKKQEKQATLALQRQRRLHEHKENLIDEALSQMEGTSLGDTLDFLSKELIRLQEERRIHAFAMLAERQRRIREAEESGRRQVEERRRREEDEIFKQVVKVHQMSVDTYLENVILNAVDTTADAQARSEIQETAIKINDIAYDMEDKRTELISEEICAELTHCFLLPEVQKQTIREKIQRQQRKFLLAAHSEIFKDGESTISQNAKQNTNQNARPDSVQRPASAQSRSASAAAEKPTSRPSSRVSEKIPSRPSSQLSHTSEKPPTGKKSPSERGSRRSSTASKRDKTELQGKELQLEITGQGSSRRDSASSEKPKDSGSRRGSASSEKHSVSGGSRKGSAHRVLESPKTSRRGSKQEAEQGVDLEIDARSAPGTPKESGSRKGSPRSGKDSRRGSTSSQKSDKKSKSQED
ncbi:cilia- and flagella-associated protein 91-like [Tubulanus polymorphus]|uniref:cilia- and flagella-associated protein 91-like n=1 Tax=Tubulanus polymorphus TaxID=672921 RepID=UPI003DA2A6A9